MAAIRIHEFGTNCELNLEIDPPFSRDSGSRFEDLGIHVGMDAKNMIPQPIVSGRSPRSGQN
jgi:hypothetical protein